MLNVQWSKAIVSFFSGPDTNNYQGGITNGQEMVASYMKDNFPGPATEAVIAMADVGDKGIEYTKGKTAENMWWLWQILRALLSGRKEKRSSGSLHRI